MSNTINVNKVSVPQTVGQTEEPQKQHHGARKTTSALFAQSSFQQVAGATLAGGVALPSLSQDQQQQINSLFGGLSDDGQKKIQGASDQLAASIWQAIGVTYPPVADGSQTRDSRASGVGAAGGAGGASTKNYASAVDSPANGVSFAAAGGVSRVASSIQTPGVFTNNNNALTQAATHATGTYTDVTGSDDLDKNVAATTYMGLIGLQTDLADFASTVSAQNNRLQTARTQYANLTDTVANWPKGQETVQFTWSDLDAKGNTVQTSGALTQDQAQAKADQLQNNTIPQLSSTNQIQQLQLQNLTQNYQQGVNTLSNVLKFQFDTVKSIIGNIRVS